MSQHFIVNGIVAKRDGKPYVQLLTEDHGIIGQWSMAEARTIANDILTMAARTEADAMIHRFFDKSQFPKGAGASLMQDFRNFRHELDQEPVETTETDPDTGEAASS